MSLFDPNLLQKPVQYELKRTFWPVGQGAFYTEVFTRKGEVKFVMVYDCGTETSADVMDLDMDKQIDEFQQSISVYSHIDLLFLSHFHSDHINGLDKLLDGVTVRKTIIPMLTQSILVVTRVQNFLRYSEDALAADQIIRELYLDGEKTGRFGDIVVVPPQTGQDNAEDGDIDGLGNGSVLGSGEKLLMESLWVYKPFNSIQPNEQRAIDFLRELSKIQNAYTGGKLNVNGLIRGCRTKVKDAYRKAMHNANDNLYTLVVESRPAEGVSILPDDRQPRCLYFSDFDSKGNNALWARFLSVFDYAAIGTVQVPHHGAKGNWRDEMLYGNSRVYVISSGSTNTYHHPDYWVVRNITQSGHSVYVVDEKKTSIFEESFNVV